MSYFKRHIFFCCNDRGPGADRPSCAQCGSQEMRDYAKARCKTLGITGQGGVAEDVPAGRLARLLGLK